MKTKEISFFIPYLLYSQHQDQVGAGLQGPQPASTPLSPWGRSRLLLELTGASRLSKACWKRQEIQATLCFFHSLSVPALVLPATRLCNTGSPGTAGWSWCWLMAPRSVLGPFVWRGVEERIWGKFGDRSRC